MTIINTLKQAARNTIKQAARNTINTTGDIIMSKGFYIVKEWDNTEAVAYINPLDSASCIVTYLEGHLPVMYTQSETRAMIVRDALQSEITL